MNPQYGSLEDFNELVEQICQRDMKDLIDIVFNHISADSLLSKEHAESFYKTAERSFGNRVGGWSDIVNLDNSHRKLWGYHIDTLKWWANLGIDGLRCDVAPLLPIEIWRRARKELYAVKENLIWLAESIHPKFIRYLRAKGMVTLSDSELYQAFDVAYVYDVETLRQAYFGNKIDFQTYIERKKIQDYTEP